ncbi:hypothetical protein Pat9b_5010 (plasmid) [Pantoea sp. At-9b]|nr:hypothetical protein Pat9b_5010 [Pantoea sp. At-9b]
MSACRKKTQAFGIACLHCCTPTIRHLRFSYVNNLGCFAGLWIPILGVAFVMNDVFWISFSTTLSIYSSIAREDNRIWWPTRLKRWLSNGRRITIIQSRFSQNRDRFRHTIPALRSENIRGLVKQQRKLCGTTFPGLKWMAADSILLLTGSMRKVPCQIFSGLSRKKISDTTP